MWTISRVSPGPRSSVCRLPGNTVGTGVVGLPSRSWVIQSRTLPRWVSSVLMKCLDQELGSKKSGARPRLKAGNRAGRFRSERLRRRQRSRRRCRPHRRRQLHRCCCGPGPVPARSGPGLRHSERLLTASSSAVAADSPVWMACWISSKVSNAASAPPRMSAFNASSRPTILEDE